jgi:hypothetical protein
MLILLHHVHRFRRRKPAWPAESWAALSSAWSWTGGHYLIACNRVETPRAADA